MADDSIAGKWKLDRSENFEEFLEEMGAPWIARKAAAKSSPTQEVIINGDNLEIKLSSIMSTNIMKFTIGTEFESEWGGKKNKAVASWEDGKLVMKETGENGETVTTRHVEGGELMMIITTPKGLVCKRIFKKCD
ncbi:PREDICTED: fatty acid-binding protein homolog 9-like [Branchiostoma belcheri]|uniref:Fatty acid-binding protein homolog 9-like n=1 Tax=Branchiostoma belcheri TaxID=7741 RepID=A0A6P4ZFX5_BRABE|nr:PREDICTED: fatty acid-binding protein homolog 9-like [Branchiostoma belcheri]